MERKQLKKTSQNKILLSQFYEFCLEKFTKDQESETSPADDDFMRVLLGLKGYDNPPQVVSDEDYANLKTFEYFRGASDYNHTASLLTKKNIRTGHGYLGGYFACKNKDRALVYCSLAQPTKNASGKVLSFKFSDANATYVSSLKHYLELLENDRMDEAKSDISQKLSELLSFINSIPTLSEQYRFYKLFKNDLSKLAVFLDYDYIVEDVAPKGVAPNENIVILNRSKMIVPISELERFCSKSRKYQKLAATRLQTFGLSGNNPSTLN